MTDALWQRMSAIESFAADVAHEIKNPLSSLRSAVETAVRIEDPVKQRRLMAIILDDVERLDRLITDISDASRLDAELSRARAGADRHRGDAARARRHPRDDPRRRRRRGSLLDLPERRPRADRAGYREPAVAGVPQPRSPTRCRSARPAARSGCRRRDDGRAVLVTVEDDGPGIPEDKLTAIFDRFYSERPAGEKFGTHSGLGLSISKQIVEAHRGRIWAENRVATRSGNGAVVGARFLIRLPAPRERGRILVHATAVAIDGRALLLRGPSGAGKSDLALRLIDAGARLIADDQSVLRREGGRLLAAVPAAIAGLIEVRGVGILRVEPPLPCRSC